MSLVSVLQSLLLSLIVAFEVWDVSNLLLIMMPDPLWRFLLSVLVLECLLLSDWCLIKLLYTDVDALELVLLC